MNAMAVVFAVGAGVLAGLCLTAWRHRRRSRDWEEYREAQVYRRKAK